MNKLVSPEYYFLHYSGELLNIDPILLERAFFFLFDEKEWLTVKRSGEVGHIKLKGALSFDPTYGEVGYDELSEKAGNLYADSKVKRVYFELMSPGGTTIGNAAAAEVLNGFAKQKSTQVWVPAYATSAAYLLAVSAASPAKSLYASPGALLASVASIRHRADRSQGLAKEGIFVHQFSGGSRKGWGASHQPLSEEEASHWKQEVEISTKEFQKGVASYGYGSEQFWADQQGGVLSARKAGVVNYVQRRSPVEMEEMKVTMEAQQKQLTELLEVQKQQASALSAEKAERKKVEQDLLMERAKALVREFQRSGAVLAGEEALAAVSKAVAETGGGFLKFLIAPKSETASSKQPDAPLPKEQPSLSKAGRDLTSLSKEELRAEIAKKGEALLDEIE